MLAHGVNGSPMIAGLWQQAHKRNTAFIFAGKWYTAIFLHFIFRGIVMYSKQEVSKLKQAFWTAFGKYMQPVLSADGESVSWINYKTGISGISFKMDADSKEVMISILLSHNDLSLQRSAYEKFLQLKAMLNENLGESDWRWEQEVQDDYGKTISRISKRLSGVNVLRNEDWPAIISFLKPRIVALDEFWSMAKYGFEGL